MTCHLVAAQQPVVPTPLTYDSALALAAARNLGLEATRRQRAVREAAVKAAGQIPNPDFAFEVSRDTPHEVVGFNVPVEIGGKRSRRQDLAREELILADVDVQGELAVLRRNVRQSFYSLIAADQQAELAQSMLDVARRVREAAQARFDAGATPRLDVLQADLGVTRMEIDLEQVRAVRVSAQTSLSAALNLPPQQPLVVTGDLSDHSAAPSYERALAMATASNVDLARLDREISVEQRRVELLRAERMPTPVFSIGGLFNSPEFGAGMSGGVGIGLPLFSRNQGEIAGSIARASQLRAERDARSRVLENEVFGILARIEARRKQAESYTNQLVPTATTLESLAEESYRAGRTSVLAVFDAQRSLRDLRRDSLLAALELQLLLADLEVLLGTPLP